MIQYLGHGRMRHAFRIGNTVIKIPYNFNGVKACLEEMILWSKYKSSAMAPVLFGIPGLCVAMPYYPQPFSGEKPKSFVTALNAFGIIDLHDRNVRMNGDHPVAIDYAINKNSSGQGEPTDE